MWASGCEYCLATDSLDVSVITWVSVGGGGGGGGEHTGGRSSMLIDKTLCFKAQSRFIKTSSLIKYGINRPLAMKQSPDLCTKPEASQSREIINSYN